MAKEKTPNPKNVIRTMKRYVLIILKIMLCFIASLLIFHGTRHAIIDLKDTNRFKSVVEHISCERGSSGYWFRLEIEAIEGEITILLDSDECEEIHQHVEKGNEVIVYVKAGSNRIVQLEKEGRILYDITEHKNNHRRIAFIGGGLFIVSAFGIYRLKKNRYR